MATGIEFPGFDKLSLSAVGAPASQSALTLSLSKGERGRAEARS